MGATRVARFGTIFGRCLGSNPGLRAAAGAVASVLISLPARASDNLELMPDIEFTSPVLLIAFAALVFPLNELIFKPLFHVIDQRDDKIAGARRRAARVKEQADEALSRYEESIRDAREAVMVERRAHSDAARAELLASTRAAKEEAAREMDVAREELERSLVGARETLQAESAELARLAAERILGRNLS